MSSPDCCTTQDAAAVDVLGCRATARYKGRPGSPASLGQLLFLSTKVLVVPMGSKRPDATAQKSQVRCPVAGTVSGGRGAVTSLQSSWQLLL